MVFNGPFYLFFPHLVKNLFNNSQLKQEKWCFSLLFLLMTWGLLLDCCCWFKHIIPSSQQFGLRSYLIMKWHLNIRLARVAFITYHYKIVWCSVSQDGWGCFFCLFFLMVLYSVFCSLLPGISPTANTSSWQEGWRLSPFTVRRRWNDIWAPCQMWVVSHLMHCCQMWSLLFWLLVQRSSCGFTSFKGSQEENPRSAILITGIVVGGKNYEILT